MKKAENRVSLAGVFTDRVTGRQVFWASLSEVWINWDSGEGERVLIRVSRYEIVQQKYQANKESMADSMIIDFKCGWPMWLWNYLCRVRKDKYCGLSRVFVWLWNMTDRERGEQW